MKNFSLTIIIITIYAGLSLMSCQSKPTDLCINQSISDTIYKFQIREQGTSFGFKYYSDVAVIQPRSICLAGQYVYIPDPLNYRINRIHLENGDIEISNAFPDSISYLSDIIVFKDKVIATTESGYLVYLDKDLKLLSINKISVGKGKFYDVGQNYFKVYFPLDNFSTFNINDKFEINRLANTPIDFRNSIHGKEFRLMDKNGKIIKTKYGVLQLDIPYTRLSFGGINVDYSDKFLCYFFIEDNILSLVVKSITQ